MYDKSNLTALSYQHVWVVVLSRILVTTSLPYVFTDSLQDADRRHGNYEFNAPRSMSFLLHFCRDMPPPQTTYLCELSRSVFCRRPGTVHYNVS